MANVSRTSILMLLGVSVTIRPALAGSPERALRIEAQFPQRWTIGSPAFVPLGVQNIGKDTVRLPEWWLFFAYPPATLEVIDEEGDSRSTKINSYAFIATEAEGEEGPVPIWRDEWGLPRGQARRAIINLGALLESLRLGPGRYRIRPPPLGSPEEVAGAGCCKPLFGSRRRRTGQR